MKAPLKGLFKTASVLMIVFGTFATVISFFGLFYSVIGLNDFAIQGSRFIELAGIFIAAILVTLIISILSLILGIMGIKLRKTVKDRFFFISGICLCLLSLTGSIMNIAGGSFNITSLGIPIGIFSIISLVLSIFIIIGSCMNEN